MTILIKFVAIVHERFDRWLRYNYSEMVTEKQNEPQLPSLKRSNTWPSQTENNMLYLNAMELSVLDDTYSCRQLVKIYTLFWH